MTDFRHLKSRCDGFPSPEQPVVLSIYFPSTEFNWEIVLIEKGEDGLWRVFGVWILLAYNTDVM